MSYHGWAKELGHALVHDSGLPDYEALVSARILTPWELSDSFINWTKPRRARQVPGFTPDGHAVSQWDFAALEGGGALKSTARDLLRFLRANLQANPDSQNPLRAALILSHLSWREIVPGQTEIGLLWMRRKLAAEPVRLWHNGATGGYRTFVGFVSGRSGVACDSLRLFFQIPRFSQTLATRSI